MSETTFSLGDTYEINKILVEKYEKELIEEEIIQKKAIVAEFIKNKNQSYYTLLCNDRKDFTVFLIEQTDDKRAAAAEVLIDECLENRGGIKGIDLTQTEDAIEIWLSIDGESYCYYFFPYDEAVIIV